MSNLSEPTMAGEEGCVEHFVEIARTLVNDWPRFSPMLEPNAASRGIAAFKAELRSRAFADFCVDYAEKAICTDGLTVDYYIGSTVVEIALNLRDPNSEFERGILKCIMAMGNLHAITRLLFLAKPGARARCNTPTRRALAAWAEREQGLVVDVIEFGPTSEGILDTNDE